MRQVTSFAWVLFILNNLLTTIQSATTTPSPSPIGTSPSPLPPSPSAAKTPELTGRDIAYIVVGGLFAVLTGILVTICTARIKRNRKRKKAERDYENGIYSKLCKRLYLNPTIYTEQTSLQSKTLYEFIKLVTKGICYKKSATPATPFYNIYTTHEGEPRFNDAENKIMTVMSSKLRQTGKLSIPNKDCIERLTCLTPFNRLQVTTSQPSIEDAFVQHTLENLSKQTISALIEQYPDDFSAITGFPLTHPSIEVKPNFSNNSSPTSPEIKPSTSSNEPYSSLQPTFGRIRGNLPQLPADYIERPTLNQEIENAFLASPMLGGFLAIQVRGFLGMGKTLFCTHFARTHQKEYDIIMYVRGDRLSFENDLRDIMASFKEPQNQSSLGDFKTESCQDFFLWLYQNREKNKPSINKILFIMDDIKEADYQKILTFLPTKLNIEDKAFHFLAISQNSLPDIHSDIYVKDFGKEEIDIIKKRFFPDPTATTRLQIALGGYPPPWMLAIHHIRLRKGSIDEFLSKFNEYTHFKYAPLGGLTTSTQRPQPPETKELTPMYKTFLAVFKNLAQENPNAARLFSYICVLHHNPIPLHLLQRITKLEDEDLHTLLKQLEGRELIQWWNGHITTHRLIALNYKSLFSQQYATYAEYAQIAINDFLKSKVTEEKITCTNHTEYKQIEEAIPHALVATSKIIWRVENFHEAELLGTAFYLIGLFYFHTNNPIGVALAAMHLGSLSYANYDAALCYGTKEVGQGERALRVKIDKHMEKSPLQKEASRLAPLFSRPVRFRPGDDALSEEKSIIKALPKTETALPSLMPMPTHTFSEDDFPKLSPKFDNTKKADEVKPTGPSP